MEQCGAILQALIKRKDASWFREPVPADTEGYSDVVTSPMDYGTIQSKLEAGGYPDAAAFASDVRLVVSNAIAYSPEIENECHIVARANLAAFEKAFLKAHLATDGGAAATAAEAAAKAVREAAAKAKLGSPDRTGGRAEAMKQAAEERAQLEAERRRQDDALRELERERARAKAAETKARKEEAKEAAKREKAEAREAQKAAKAQAKADAEKATEEKGKAAEAAAKQREKEEKEKAKAREKDEKEKAKVADKAAKEKAAAQAKAEKEAADAARKEEAAAKKADAAVAAAAARAEREAAAKAKKEAAEAEKLAKELTMPEMERCATILQALIKRKDASWFREPVPADTEGYSDVVTSPMDYGTIQSKLEAGGYPDAAAFASDVRLVVSNAIAYSPEIENECHIVARANLAAFEKAFLKAHLATDGGAAATAAEKFLAPPQREGRKRTSEAAELDK